MRFRIEPAPQYCDEQGRLICSPGSYIEGNIYIELAEPLAAMQLKLIYKGIGECVYVRVMNRYRETDCRNPRFLRILEL